MNRRIIFAVTPLACLSLGACATPEGYPSLAVRDSERVTGSMEAPAGTGFVPSPATPATLDNLAALARTAREAHQRFVAATGETATLVGNATGSDVGSDAWARAQVALANLEASRSQAMIALADIDRIYVDAATGGGEVAQLEAVRSEISALVDSENATIEGLLARLAG